MNKNTDKTFATIIAIAFALLLLGEIAELAGSRFKKINVTQPHSQDEH